MPNLAMRQPGTQFSADGLDISWPIGGERDVVAVPDEMMSLRIRRRVAEGQISIVDDKPTKEVGEGEREYRLLTGEEARKHFLEPAGPVTRIVYRKADEFDEDEDQREVRSVQGLSDRFVAAQEVAAEKAEEDHQAISKAQIEAEKEAEKEAKKAEKEEAEPDPLAERLALSQKAADELALKRDKEFMEIEKARKKVEDEWAVEPAKPDPDDEPDTKEAEAKAAAAEKERQAVEKEVEAKREKEAKAAQEAEKKSANDQKALSESTPTKAPAKGSTPTSKGGQPTSHTTTTTTTTATTSKEG